MQRYEPIKLSCNIFLELVKNGRSDGFGVDPTDKLSMSGPESSPSHDNDSNSWNNASNSRSPARNPPPARVTLPSSSSGTLKRFNRATIFCLKFLCCNGNEMVFQISKSCVRRRHVCPTLTLLILARDPLSLRFSNSLSLSTGLVHNAPSSPSFSDRSSLRYFRRSCLAVYPRLAS